MRKVSSLTLKFLKSLYPKADLGSGDEGVTATCSKKDDADLVQSFLEMATRVIDMIPIDVS
jgi:hypothetical protein